MCLTLLTRTSHTILDRSGKSLVPSRWRKALSPLSIVLTRVLVNAFYQVDGLPFLLRVFMMNGCWIRSYVFSHIYWDKYYVFSFLFVNMMKYMDCHLNVKSAFRSWDKPLLIMVYYPLLKYFTTFHFLVFFKDLFKSIEFNSTEIIGF